MKAVTWHGKRDVRVDAVPDPKIEHPTDAIVRITSTGICGSDLHLYEVLGPFLSEGDILGHEPMGIVEEVGGEVTEIRPGDTIWTPPGEWHWHGAAPGHFMTHLAMWEGLADGQEGPETSWGDLVTDEEYNA